MSTNLTFEDLYRTDHGGLIISTGISISSLFTGGLIVLGALCLCLLSEEKKPFRRQKVILQTYIIVLVILDLGLQITYLLSPHAIAIFHAGSYEDADEKFHRTLRIPVDLFPVLIFSLTDGLFIWRCYILQQCLGFKPDCWRHIFWVVPGCFWTFNLAAGLTLIFIDTNNPNQHPLLLRALASAIFASNATITLYATLFICFCLYTHQRNTVASHGVQITPGGFRYRCVVRLLVQFAVVTVPIAVVAAVELGLGRGMGMGMGGMWMGRTAVAWAVVPVAGSSQAFTSILMIHQVLGARRDDVDAHVEGVELVPVVSDAYELSLREDVGGSGMVGKNGGGGVEEARRNRECV